MKKKELCWAVVYTVMTFYLGFIMFYDVDLEYVSETEKILYYIINGLALCMMLCLSGLFWITAMPEKDNDNEG